MLDRPVLVRFYTGDFTPDCIEEWCAFRDFDWFASGREVRVVGVSRSGPRLHRQFIDRLGPGFPLFADADPNVAEATGRSASPPARAGRASSWKHREIRYRWLGDHWLDPSRDAPPVGEIHDAVRAELDDGDDAVGF